MRRRHGRGSWRSGSGGGRSLFALEVVNSLLNRCGEVWKGEKLLVLLIGCMGSGAWQWLWAGFGWILQAIAGVAGAAEWGIHEGCQVKAWGLLEGRASLGGGRRRWPKSVTTVRAEVMLGRWRMLGRAVTQPWQLVDGLEW